MKASLSGTDTCDRGGGKKFNAETGQMEQTKDHESTSSRVTVFSRNQRDNVPVVLILGRCPSIILMGKETNSLAGAKNKHCPTRVPHRYNVMGLFHVTDTWSEKVNGKKVCRVRFDMIDLETPSWWGIKGSLLPPQKPDFATKALVHICTICGVESKQRHALGWVCLNEPCTNFARTNGQFYQQSGVWNPAYVNERTKWPSSILSPLKLKPAPPMGLSDGSLRGTSSSAWKGMVCPRCGRCNSRIKWDEWRCETNGCTFEIPIHHQILQQHELEPHNSFPTEGHSIPCDRFVEPVIRTGQVHGYWRVCTYELFPGNFVTHYLANQVTNRQPGGADEILQVLQGSKMGLQRFNLKRCHSK